MVGNDVNVGIGRRATLHKKGGHKSLFANFVGDKKLERIAAVDKAVGK